MRRLEHPAEEQRRIHQLQLRVLLHSPTAHQQQRSQSSGIELPDFRNVEHQHSQAFRSLDPAPVPSSAAPRTMRPEQLTTATSCKHST